MNLLATIVVALVLAAIMTRSLENQFIYFPSRSSDPSMAPAVGGSPLEDIWMTTQDGVRIHGWFHRAAISPLVLLWFHGNAGSMADRLDQFHVLASLEMNILAIDYRGYGRSAGSPHEAGLYRDADAAYGYLVKQGKFNPRQILIYGQSLGGAVAADLASRRECGGLILEATFTTGREMARRMFLIPFFQYLPKSRFDTLGKIGQVRAPVLIIHGEGDTVIPFEMGQRLFQAAPEPKTFCAIRGAGHDDPYVVGGERFLGAVRDLARMAHAASTPIGGGVEP